MSHELATKIRHLCLLEPNTKVRCISDAVCRFVYLLDKPARKQRLDGKSYFVYRAYNLKVRNADIEALIHIGVPHNPNIGDKEGSEVTLKNKN